MVDDKALEAMTGLLAAYDATCEPCPARKKSLGDQNCPRCRAGPDQGCGLDAQASNALVSALRSYLKETGRG